MKITYEMLTDEQKECVLDMSARYQMGQPIMSFTAYAGAGKTTIIKHIIEKLNLAESEVAYTAYTGKAALVLTNKGMPATTIHKLIYKVTKLKDGTLVSSKIPRDEFPSRLKLIVVDEVSMCSEKMIDELASYGVPILCLGDKGQLPPIEGELNRFVKDSDYSLQEIMRQAEGNSIIAASKKIRETGNLDLNYNDDFIRTVDSGSLSVEHLAWADQILCGTNMIRHALNNDMRSHLGFTSPVPEVGDKIIITENAWNVYDTTGNWNPVNGMIGFVTSIEQKGFGTMSPYAYIDFRPEFDQTILFKLKIDTAPFHGLSPFDNYKKDRHFRNRNGKPKAVDFRIHVDFAYAITVHKSQGSEWDKVLIYAKDFTFSQKELGYTAITRASKKLVWVR